MLVFILVIGFVYWIILLCSIVILLVIVCIEVMLWVIVMVVVFILIMIFWIRLLMMLDMIGLRFVVGLLKKMILGFVVMVWVRLMCFCMFLESLDGKRLVILGVSFMWWSFLIVILCVLVLGCFRVLCSRWKVMFC